MFISYGQPDLFVKKIEAMQLQAIAKLGPSSLLTTNIEKSIAASCICSRALKVCTGVENNLFNQVSYKDESKEYNVLFSSPANAPSSSLRPLRCWALKCK